MSDNPQENDLILKTNKLVKIYGKKKVIDELIFLNLRKILENNERIWMNSWVLQKAIIFIPFEIIKHNIKFAIICKKFELRVNELVQ